MCSFLLLCFILVTLERVTPGLQGKWIALPGEPWLCLITQQQPLLVNHAFAVGCWSCAWSALFLLTVQVQPVFCGMRRSSSMTCQERNQIALRFILQQWVQLYGSTPCNSNYFVWFWAGLLPWYLWSGYLNCFSKNIQLYELIICRNTISVNHSR